MAQISRFITHNRRISQSHHYQITRSLVDISSINWVRDRALDQAVEKEYNLRPVVNIKNFIKSQPSKSAPISIIVDNREILEIPTRPIEFIRRLPAVFEEFYPSEVETRPHIRLTPETLNLDEDEQLMYQSDAFRKQAADRLLKVLMLTRAYKLPLCLVDRLKWDLGLPQDYVETFLPEFPDCFQIKNNASLRFPSSDKRVLELVCWNDDLAVSAMEKKAMKENRSYEKGMPIEFPVQYSTTFVMDKVFENWVDYWQKLPYISPYENASHFASSSDESDRWSASVLHELLHTLVPKKTERENLLDIGEYLGLRGRFRKSILQHPGIFYVSNKNKTHTVLLREGYKRELLIEKHVLMDMRSKYAHLMHTAKKLPKSESRQNQRKVKVSKGKGEKEGDSENDYEADLHGSSDSEVEDTGNEHAFDDDDEDEEEDGYQIDNRKNDAVQIDTGNEHAFDDDDEDDEDEEEDDFQIDNRKNDAVRGQRNHLRTNVPVSEPPRIHGQEKKLKGRIRPSRINGGEIPFGGRDANRGPSRIQGEENPVGGRKRPSTTYGEENPVGRRNPDNRTSRIHGEENPVGGRRRPSTSYGEENPVGRRNPNSRTSRIQGEENPVGGRGRPSTSYGEENPVGRRNPNNRTSRSRAEENRVAGRSPSRGPSRSHGKENQDEGYTGKPKGRVHSKFSLRTETKECRRSEGKFSEKSCSPRAGEKSRPGSRTSAS